MIEFDHVEIRAGAFRLPSITVTIPTGSYCVLLGKSGAGKTTLLEAVCGLKAVHAGRIRLLGRDVTTLPPAQRGVGLVPQDGALFPTMTVRENIAFALAVRKWESSRIARRVDELAEMLDITPLLARRVPGLSGGEKQRVALGRALAFAPAILCLDEPLSALDDDTRAEMIALLRTVRAETAVTTLHITHSLPEARTLANLCLRLQDGQLAPLAAVNDANPAAPRRDHDTENAADLHAAPRTRAEADASAVAGYRNAFR